MLKKSIMLLFVFMIVATSQMFAQFTAFSQRELTDAGLVTYAASCSAATTTSDWINLQKYDDESYLTNPVSFLIKYNSATSKPRLTTTVEFSNDKSNVLAAVDTVGLVSDSLETVRYFDINFNGKKALYARLKVTEESGNPNDATLTGTIYFHRKDKK